MKEIWIRILGILAIFGSFGGIMMVMGRAEYPLAYGIISTFAAMIVGSLFLKNRVENHPSV